MRSCVVLATTCLALAAAAPVEAAVTVIGNSAARLCYEAARSHNTSAGAVAQCDDALKLMTLTPEDEVATYVNRGILRATRGDVPGALADYDQALRRNPREPEAWLNKGFATLRQGDPAASVTFFDKAVSNKTREPAVAHYGRGIAHEQAGNLRAAYADFVRARDLSPEWPAPRNELIRFQVRPRPALR